MIGTFVERESRESEQSVRASVDNNIVCMSTHTHTRARARAYDFLYSLY